MLKDVKNGSITNDIMDTYVIKCTTTYTQKYFILSRKPNSSSIQYSRIISLKILKITLSIGIQINTGSDSLHLTF